MDDVTAAAAAETAAAADAKHQKRQKGWAKQRLKDAKAHRPAKVPVVDPRQGSNNEPGPPSGSSSSSSSSSLRIFGGFVPWWVIFLLCVYLCVKLMSLYESPCAILGIQNPATKRSIARAYRQLSKCTHPDRLVKFGSEAQVRGEVLFRRIAGAKEDLSHALRVERASNVSCYTGGGPFATEAALLALVKEALGTSDGRQYTGNLLSELARGLLDIVTLEHGIVALLILGLTLMTVSRHCCALRREASQQTCGSVLMRIPLIILVGPLEVTSRLLLVPLVRWGVFVDNVRRITGTGGANTNADENNGRGEGGSHTHSKDEGARKKPIKSSAGIAAVSAGSTGPTRRRAARARGETDAQRKDRETGAVIGSNANDLRTEVLRLIADTDAKQQKQQTKGRFARCLLGFADKVPPLRGLRQLHRAVSSQAVQVDPARLPAGVKLTNASLSQGDDFAAGAVQGDFVLSVTKPVIPLALLIATGENMNGFWSSLVIMSFLQRLPKIGADALHLGVFFFGVVHTFLEASAVHRMETAAGDMQVVLKWQWTLSDVLLAANLVLVGSTFASVSRNGNGPALLSSFASGVAVRVLMSMLVPAGAAEAASSAWEALFPPDEMLVQFQTNAEVSSWAGAGVGDCGGGPLRMFFSQSAEIVDVCLRSFLIVLPALHALQWSFRVYRAMVSGRRRRRWLRVCRRMVFAVGAFAQCYLIMRLTLGGLNGSLVGFFAVLVFATHVESLLNTYDVRGPVRQALNYIIFIML
eukprot:INCI19216.2.p1 GENE.INCI19216.2~~INCI19216.2.p1  ORF type:complete len:755 (-),score=116.87 INCI19216.2:1128-3392(-)